MKLPPSPFPKEIPPSISLKQNREQEQLCLPSLPPPPPIIHSFYIIKHPLLLLTVGVGVPLRGRGQQQLAEEQALVELRKQGPHAQG